MFSGAIAGDVRASTQARKAADRRELRSHKQSLGEAFGELLSRIIPLAARFGKAH
jgi:hypothetical protein